MRKAIDSIQVRAKMILLEEALEDYLARIKFHIRFKKLEKRVQEIEDSVIDGKVPKGEASGLCQFCKYQTKCFNQGDGIEHKPLSTPKLEVKKK